MDDSKSGTNHYREKRDFRSTSEPKDESVDFDWADRRPIFVIQQHDASQMHFDFRLEVDGVLRS